jgi:hypothetical protein
MFRVLSSVYMRVGIFSFPLLIDFAFVTRRKGEWYIINISSSVKQAVVLSARVFIIVRRL